LKLQVAAGDEITKGRDRTESKAMRYMPHLLCFGILLGGVTQALAKPAYVASTVNLRAAPGTTSEVVAKIPGGSLIDADNCTEGWCAVIWQGKSGFAIQTALDMSGRLPQRRAARGPVYVEDPDEYVAESPPVFYESRPYYYGYGPYYRGGWGWRHRW
jgi:uncharacterized protein YraI